MTADPVALRALAARVETDAPKPAPCECGSLRFAYLGECLPFSLGEDIVWRRAVECRECGRQADWCGEKPDA